jgi:hypothetical protein
MMPQMISGDINVIGFSFTGFGDTTSFGGLLQKSLNDRGYASAVREISYGGLSVNALAGLIGTAIRPVKLGDWITLELATSFFSQHGYKMQDALPYVFHLVNYLLERGHRKLFFLNLYRRDLDDNDCVVQAIRAVGRHFAIPILDLKKSFRDAAVDAAFGTTDGAHPDLGSRQRIADEMECFLLSQPTHAQPRTGDLLGPSYSFVEFSTHPHDCEVFHYEARGKQMTALVLPALDRFHFDLGKPMFVVGYCFLYGPETGMVQWRMDEGDGIALITYDEHSYYRRIGFRPVQKFGRYLEMLALEETRDVALVRPSGLKAGTRREFVCGVVLKDDTNSLPADLLAGALTAPDP